MVNRPITFNSYEFVVVSSLRAKQLLAGCVAHVDGEHTPAIKAQTLSPARKPSAPSPSAATVPATSRPGMVGAPVGGG